MQVEQYEYIMPKIFEYFGFIFYFYSNEHEPIHVHVIHGGKESIYKGGSYMGRIYIIDAENLGNLTVSLTFNDNTKQTVDVGDFIRRHPHPQYNKYLDPRKFSRFTIDNGNIVWGKNWDLIFPIEQLYSGNLS